MIPHFDYRTFVRIGCLSLFGRKKASAPLTIKRRIFLFAFFVGLFLVELFNSFCFLLDCIFFPDWRQVELDKPVFIIGNPRSGTTFLHRLMAKDEQRFFCFKTWEIMFPAIVQKKSLALAGRLDELLNSRCRKWMQRVESRWFRSFNRMHRISVFSPEEDDKVLMHIFSFHGLAWIFPFPELLRFFHFDHCMGPEDRRRIMTFYKDCIKRQSYFKGGKGQFLSKNPVSSLKVASLYEYFPGCRFVYMVRNPLRVVPSTLSIASEIWRAASNLGEDHPFRDEVYQTIKRFYDYPLSQFQRASENSYALVKYEDLVRHPSQVMRTVYDRLGFDVGREYSKILEVSDMSAAAYQSQHVYSLQRFNLSSAKVASDFRDVIDRFAYPVAAEDGTDEAVGGGS